MDKTSRILIIKGNDIMKELLEDVAGRIISELQFMNNILDNMRLSFEVLEEQIHSLNSKIAPQFGSPLQEHRLNVKLNNLDNKDMTS